MGEKQKQKNFKEKIEFKIWNLQGYVRVCVCDVCLLFFFASLSMCVCVCVLNKYHFFCDIGTAFFSGFYIFDYMLFFFIHSFRPNRPSETNE